MLRPLLPFILILIFSCTSVAIEISGKKIDYAGRSLVFYKYADPVSLQKEIAFKVEFNEKGEFRSELNISSPTYIFCDFGIYRGMLFLEANKNLEILLPPFREKSFADQKNPFFKPVAFWFNTTNKYDLSFKISKFETEFNRLTGKFFNQLYFRQSKVTYDSVLIALNHIFPENSTEMFSIYRSLKIKSLETDVFRLKSEDCTQIFSSLDNVVYWNQPAFLEFFEKTFNNKLGFEAKDVKGKEIRKAVAESDTDFLLSFINYKYKLKGIVADLVLIKLLHDGFYSGEFPKNSILKLLNSKELVNNPSIPIRKTTKNVIDKLTHLQQGKKAPVICLNDIDNQKYCTNETKEKFKYLIFADIEMIVCREHLKYLSMINQKYHMNLEIIVVLRKTSRAAIKSFVTEFNIPGKILVDEKKSNIETYKIKSFPQCFLLDQAHQVVFEQTKAPLDGFEQQFGSFLRRELFERQRN